MNDFSIFDRGYQGVLDFFLSIVQFSKFISISIP